MFHQVRVASCDWDSLYIWWWPDGKLTQPPEEHQMLAHLLEALSSPSICRSAFRKVANHNEMRTSPKTIVRSVQQASVVKEILALEDKPGFNSKRFTPNKTLKRSPLQKLCLVKVQGILRVGGCLQRSPLPDEEKHPIILLSMHVVTHLIIEDFHRREDHAGPLHTIAVLREHYWVVKG